MWKYTLWYYEQMDLIFVPSQSTGDELAQKGIPPYKIRLFPRGIDVARFHPSRRSGELSLRHNLGDGLRLLYVGRISREKNLHLLEKMFRSLVRSVAADVRLVVVGDGPYLKEMRENMKGLPCVFTGYLEGEELASMYASCDIFVFPSTTDTFGNVVLEAQASGLPVVVSDAGGPQENMIHEVTGFITRADDMEGLLQAVARLISDSRLRTRMGRAARMYAEERSFEKAYDETWRDVRRGAGPFGWAARKSRVREWFVSWRTSRCKGAMPHASSRGVAPMTRTYVMDTNVLLHNPQALFAFEENEVVVPLVVIEEIDNQKKRQDEVGRNARTVSQLLDTLRSSGSLADGVALPGGGVVRIEVNHLDCPDLPKGLEPQKNDNRILAVAYALGLQGREAGRSRHQGPEPADQGRRAGDTRRGFLQRQGRLRPVVQGNGGPVGWKRGTRFLLREWKARDERGLPGAPQPVVRDQEPHQSLAIRSGPILPGGPVAARPVRLGSVGE